MFSPRLCDCISSQWQQLCQIRTNFYNSFFYNWKDDESVVTVDWAEVIQFDMVSDMPRPITTPRPTTHYSMMLTSSSQLILYKVLRTTWGMCIRCKDPFFDVNFTFTVRHHQLGLQPVQGWSTLKAALITTITSRVQYSTRSTQPTDSHTQRSHIYTITQISQNIKQTWQNTNNLSARAQHWMLSDAVEASIDEKSPRNDSTKLLLTDIN